MKDKVYSFCPSPGGGGSPDRKDTMSRKDYQVGERSQNLGDLGIFDWVPTKGKSSTFNNWLLGCKNKNRP